MKITSEVHGAKQLNVFRMQQQLNSTHKKRIFLFKGDFFTTNYNCRVHFQTCSLIVLLEAGLYSKKMDISKIIHNK